MAKVNIYHIKSFKDIKRNQVELFRIKDEDKRMFFIKDKQEVMSFTIHIDDIKMCNNEYAVKHYDDECVTFWNELIKLRSELVSLLNKGELCEVKFYPLESWDNAVIPLKSKKTIDICSIG